MIEKSKKVDCLVVGAGIAGIYSAALRAKQGKEVLLVDTDNKIGGRWSPELRDGFQFGAGISFSNFDIWKEAITKIELPIETIAIENHNCLLFNQKSWNEAENLPKWESYFARHTEQMPKGGLAGFFKAILEQESFRYQLSTPVTELVVEEGKAVRATLGKDQTIEFAECLWASSSNALAEVLSGNEMIEKGASRLAWMRKFIANVSVPGVVLEFAHSQTINDFTETLALPFTLTADKDKKRYIMGAFVANRDQTLAPEGKQLSSWIFTLKEEEREDNHEIMKRIKSAKRAIERCFPGFEKSIQFERIQVLQNTIAPGKKNSKAEKFTDYIPNIIPVADWAAKPGAHFEGMFQHIFDI